MKKISILLITIAMFVFSFHAQAITHTVTVQDFSFNPSSMTVSVGDTISWSWVNGTHTTASQEVPAGAQTWGPAAINSTSTSFNYVVMVAGTYNYDCTIHPSLMTGSFTASVSSGISPVAGNYGLILNTQLLAAIFILPYSLAKAASPDILLYKPCRNRSESFSNFVAHARYL